MRKKRDTNLSFRLDRETHDKLFYIAEYEGRTGSGHVLHIIRQDIAAFEKKHGKIELDKQENG